MSSFNGHASSGIAIVAADIVKRCLSVARASNEDAVMLFADVVSILGQMNLSPAQDATSQANVAPTPSHVAPVAHVTPVAAKEAAPSAGQNWVPAMNPLDSISADGNTIYCLVDGAPMKMLKRYIKRWGFTPDSYRQAFGLPGNYPMTAPGYAALKSGEALRIGLGTRENKAGMTVAERHVQMACHA